MDRYTQLDELVRVFGPLSDRRQAELSELHREMVQSGELPAERQYEIQIDTYPELGGDFEETTLYWRQERCTGEVVWHPVRTGSDWSIAAALCRHGAGRDRDGYYFAAGFWNRLIGAEGLYHGREFTSSQVVEAADGAEADANAALGTAAEAQAEAER